MSQIAVDTEEQVVNKESERFWAGLGYLVKTEEEENEIVGFYANHPELFPKAETDIKATPLKVNAARHRWLNEVFGDSYECRLGESYCSMVARIERSRKELIEKAGLNGDEDELLKSLMDDMTPSEIREYYGIDKGKYNELIRAIRKKLHYARN